MTRRVLIVEPDLETRRLLMSAAGKVADVVCQPTFAAARQYVLSGAQIDFLVTNVRLGDYNGLHLVYLAAGRDTPPRSIAYTDTRDPGLAREARRAGAFYDTRTSLVLAIATYLRAALPARDQRQAPVDDRRWMFRGGRRSADRFVHSLPGQTGTGTDAGA